MYTKRKILPILLLLCCCAAAFWNERPAPEGVIAWGHDFSAAQRHSHESDKPILALSDDAAGRRALDGCLAHPVIADAVRDLFVPVIVPEAHAHVPMIRILDADGHELVPSPPDELSPASVISRLVVALHASHRDVPAYLQLVDDEYNPADLRKATFAVGCYWDGEQELGKLAGVVSTRTGTLDKDEVVEVTFDAGRIGPDALLREARTLSCFDSVKTPGTMELQPADDQQHALAGYPEYCYLPLTLLQATRINAALADHSDPVVFLSASQSAMHDQLREIVTRLGGDALGDLQIDRSPEGLRRYAQSVRRLIAQIGAGPMVARHS
jgi:hypothetical protein